MNNKTVFLATVSLLPIMLPVAAQAQQATSQAQPIDTSNASQASTEEGSKKPFKADDSTEQRSDDVVVTGIRESLRAARDIKQRSDAIVNVVAAEDIGKLPANTALEAIAHLPGVSTYHFRGELQTPQIRGLSQVLTTVNGRESFVGVDRAALLNIYPADLIKSIEVYNALTPETIEGGIAGSINISLRRPLDFKKGIFGAVSLKGTVEDGNGKKSYAAAGIIGRRWDTSIGEVGVLFSGSFQDFRYYDSYHDNYQRTQVVPGQITSGVTDRPDLVFPNGIATLHSEGYFKRSFVSGTLQWKPADKLDVLFEVTRIGDYNDNRDNDFTVTIANPFTPTPLSNVTVVPGTNVIRSATFFPADPGGPRVQDAVSLDHTFQYEGAITYSGDRVKLSTDLVYTTSEVFADQRLFQAAFNSNHQINAIFQNTTKDGGNSYNFGNVNLLDPTNYHVNAYYTNRYSAKSTGIQWRGDVDWDVGPGFIRKIKVGARYTDRKAAFERGDRFVSVGSLAIPLTAIPGGNNLSVVERGFRGLDLDLPASWIGYNPASLHNNTTYLALNQYIASASGNSAFATLDPANNPLYAFSANERTAAAYAQMSYELLLGSMPINGVIGVRAVNTHLGINSTQISTTLNPDFSLTTVDTTVNGSQSYWNIDPSVSAVLHFDDKIQLRLTATKTFTRPDFSQLNPAINLFVSGSTAGTRQATSGNPNLKPYTSKNLDASLEAYFGRAGSAAFALFYRDINGFIINSQSQQSLPGSTEPVTLTRPINAGAGTLKGAEASFSTFFDFLHGWTRNFGVGANFTYIDSSQKLPQDASGFTYVGTIPGISKFIYNLSAFYNNKKLSAAVSYNWRSRFLFTIDQARINDLNWNPIKSLDASATYSLSPKLSFTVDGTNLLGQSQSNSFGANDFTARIYYNARVFSAALRVKL